MDTKAQDYRRREKKAEEHADEAHDQKVEAIWRDAALKWRLLADLAERNEV
jgi:hypothetical protein